MAAPGQALLCPRCRTRFDTPLELCPHDGKRLVPDLTGLDLGGRYTLSELLGVGGMDSSVWLAMQAPVERPVAVKLLPPTTQQAAERFARGARIASKLNHPHITVVHDYGCTDDGHLFLVMELLEGHTLQSIVKRGPLAFERVLHITDQILKALDHAHRRHVVHRDIKPGNLFLTQRNDDPDFIKVLDFGIARFVDDPDGSLEGQDLGDEITTARQICGTPQYMAPEQITGGPVDQRSDLYALGVVVYRMLTGRLPFIEKDHGALFMHHVHSAPPPLAEARPGLTCPPDLEAIVLRALAKHPSDRYASAAEMRRALRQIQRRLGLLAITSEDSASISRVDQASGTLSQTRALPAVKRDRRPLWALLAVFLVSIGITLAVMWPGPEPGADRPDAAPVTPVTAAVGVPQSAPPAAAPDAAPPPVDAAPPPPDAAVREGTAHLISEPPGATVRNNQGRELGRTPLTVRLRAGAQTLRLEHAGHLPATVLVDVPADGEATRRIRLEATAPPPRPARRRAADRPARPRPARSSSKAPAPTAPPVAVATKPTPAAPPSAPATAPAAPTRKPDTVRMQLLDEDGARTFDVGSKPAARPASQGGSAKPKIELLD